MNQFTDKEQLGEYGKDKLIINWNSLLAYRGQRELLQKSERLIGRVLLIASLIFTISGLLTFLQSKALLSKLFFGQSNGVVFIWLGILVGCYGLYLTRSRSKYEDNQIKGNLYRLIGDDRGEDLLITKYLSNALFNTIDRHYHSDNENFWKVFFSSILKDNLSFATLKRLGLTDEQLQELADYDFGPANFEALYKDTFFKAFAIGVDMQSRRIDFVHFLLAMIQNSLYKKLLTFNVTNEDINGMIVWLRNDQQKQKYRDIWKQKSVLKPKGPVNRAYTSVYAKNLEEYGIDYTHQVANGSFELMIGRDKEINDLMSSLRSQTGAAVIMVSKPGVGKTRLLKHLAVRMVVEDVPADLKDMRLVSYEFNKAFSYIKSLEEFKYKMLSVLEETARSKDIILVLDDLDQLLSIRNEISSEVLNLIISSVNKLNVKVIATVSDEAYAKHIQTNSVMLNAFRVVKIVEPSKEVLLQILIDEVAALERKYQVSVSFNAIKTLVDLSGKVAYDKAMPSKALAMLEELMLVAQTQSAKNIDTAYVSSYISQKIGVSVGSLTANESQKLMNLESEMHGRVIGQDAAVNAIAAALRRARAGLEKSSKPIASFLFYGPTGVGKTEVARTLAALYFGDEKSMVRLDMSEYQEQENLDRLIGVQHNGEFSGGFLTEPIRNRPYSLVLLDELEKANPKVLDLFLQVLDEGHITDGLGRKVDFTNTIIIATSNIASGEIAEGILAGKSYEEVYNMTLAILRSSYRVEFLNRFDQVIMFKTLQNNEVEQIVKIVLEKLTKTLLERGITVVFAADFVTEIARLAYNPVYGAREVGRVVQERVENKIADLIVSGQVTGGKVIKFNSLDNVQVE